MHHEEQMRRFAETDLYVVITEAFCGGRSSLEVLEAVLEAGVRVVQLREKDMPDGDLYRLGLEFRERTASVDALLIVDDRVDIAQAIQADGVHLGQSDLPMTVARRIAPELILGASSHSIDEAVAAQAAGASYVNIGPIFDTQTKAVPSGTVGPGLIDAIAPCLRVPFSVMGGIKEHNIGEVVGRGARHIAVVTAVTTAPDVCAAAKRLREMMVVA